MSNNVLNIHTCSDSCAALVNLIKYVAADGDISTGSMESLVEPNSQNEVMHFKVIAFFTTICFFWETTQFHGV